MDSSDTRIAAGIRDSLAGSRVSIIEISVYVGVVMCSFVNALIGQRFTTADTIVYLDLSEAIRHHQWHSIVNAYWFPPYSALLALAKALFGNQIRYELLATRLVLAATSCLFVLASIALAAAIRRLVRARSADPGELLPSRTLYIWVAALAFSFCSEDFVWFTPDPLVSSLMLLTVAALLLAAANPNLIAFLAVGAFGGLTYLTKAFGFPFFFLTVFFAGLLNLHNPRVLRGLSLSLFVFAVIAGPYIALISHAKGRFTFGESGRLDIAWYVNGMAEGNPGWGKPPLQHASAPLKHPAEILSADPQILYFDEQKVSGTIPGWDDPSYWLDGLNPHFDPGQFARSLKRNLGRAEKIVLRLPMVALIGILCYWGYTIRRSSFADPMLVAAAFLALACIGVYSIVLLEGRYVASSYVLLGTLFAASSMARAPFGNSRSLHWIVVGITVLLFLGSLSRNFSEWRLTRQTDGARVMQGIYKVSVVSAGADLDAMYPPGSEVACMGYLTCYDDSYWAKFAGLSITAVIEGGHEWQRESASEACQKLDRNPQVFPLLRHKGIRAIVARFDGVDPCFKDWRLLPGSSDYFYLAL